jgi:hypothetical protein
MLPLFRPTELLQFKQSGFHFDMLFMLYRFLHGPLGLRLLLLFLNVLPDFAVVQLVLRSHGLLHDLGLGF